MSISSVWSSITIRQLLSHKSGIPDCLSNDELYEFLNNPCESNLPESTDTLFIEGNQGQYNYSNSNYFILTRLLEVKLAPRHYSDILNEFVSNLKMSNTGLVKGEEDLDGKTGGRWKEDTGKYELIPLKLKHAGGAAGMYSTINDMVRFARVIVNLRKGIQGESLANSGLTKDIIDKALTKGDGEYGLGFRFFENGSFGHGGMYGGFRTKLMMNSKGQGVIEMQDQINATPKIADAIYDYFILNTKQPKLFPEFRLKNEPLSATLLSSFTTPKRYANSTVLRNRVKAYELYSNGSKLMATKYVKDSEHPYKCVFEIKLADVANDSAMTFVRDFQPERIVLGESQITVSIWDYNDGWTTLTFMLDRSFNLKDWE